MHHPTLLLLASAASLALAVELIPGYTIVPISWAIEVSPGQVSLLNGTIQEALAQAIAVNPGYEIPSEGPVTADAVRSPRRRSLDRRAEVKFCNKFARANVNTILDGVKTIRRMPLGVVDQAWLGPGPGACARVSCSKDSAIYWCNDTPGYKTITWDGMANSAKHITEVCPSVKDGSVNYVSGQNFETSNWNTIVRGEKC